MDAQATQQFAAGWAVASPPGWQPSAYLVQQRGNGQAVAALVLGITSIVFCWWGLFTLAQIVLAVVFACVGMSKASRGAGGHGLAVAGLVCGCVGAVAYVIVGLFTLGLGFIV
jgi:ABC-type phosphate transport system permease subunit